MLRFARDVFFQARFSKKFQRRILLMKTDFLKTHTHTGGSLQSEICAFLLGTLVDTSSLEIIYVIYLKSG